MLLLPIIQSNANIPLFPDMAKSGGISRLALYRSWCYVERRYIEVGGKSMGDISSLAVYRGFIHFTSAVDVTCPVIPV